MQTKWPSRDRYLALVRPTLANLEAQATRALGLDHATELVDGRVDAVGAPLGSMFIGSAGDGVAQVAILGQGFAARELGTQALFPALQSGRRFPSLSLQVRRRRPAMHV